MFHRHWREPQFWRWLWRERVKLEVKALVGVVLAALVLGGGWLAADRLATAGADSGELTLETTVQRIVTVREKGRVVVRRSVSAGTATSFKTLTDMTTAMVTVHGGVQTVRKKVVVHIPVVTKRVVTVNGKTKTVVTTLLRPTTSTETRTSTVTQVQTRTQIQAQTVTATRTLTEPVTTTRTVTQPVTTIQTTTTTTTVPVTVTVTVTQPFLTVTL